MSEDAAAVAVPGDPGPVDAELVPGTDIEPYVNEDGEILVSGAAALRLRELLAAMPVDDENGNQRIAERLMTAGSVLALNAPWEATSGKDLAGKKIRIDSVKARPSRFSGGLGAFLVAEGIDLADGAEMVMTTSAMAVVIQLARLTAEGWLPAWAEIVVADRPTESGYYPYHLVFQAPPPRSVR